MKARTVAIVGATGAVGRELISILEEREFPCETLRLLASERSAGAELPFRGAALSVEPLREGAFAGVDLALFSAGAGVARQHAPLAVEAGAIAVDNSSAFRLDPEVPLVVPECNADALAGHSGIIANPNCSTILLVVPLAALHREAGLKRVVVSTYQAASGAGNRAMDELRTLTRDRLEGRRGTPEVLPHSLAFNLFPQVDVFRADGYTKEEDKMLLETRKILGIDSLPVEATCVRVPVERCHCEAVTVELERAVSVARAREIFENAPGLVVRDDPEAGLVPQPTDLAGHDPIAVGRIRDSRVFDPGLVFWIACDQLRKGAALNAVQIAENL